MDVWEGEFWDCDKDRTEGKEEEETSFLAVGLSTSDLGWLLVMQPSMASQIASRMAFATLDISS